MRTRANPAHWPEWAQDEIVTGGDLHIGRWALIKMFFGIPLEIRCATQTESIQGRVKAQLTGTVRDLRRPWRRVVPACEEAAVMPLPSESEG